MSANGTIGAFPPPPGVSPNFHDPKSIAYRVIIASVLGPVVAIPLCVLRLYTKRYVLRNTGYDDYAIALATLLALAFSILAGIQTTNGLGNHVWDVPAYKYNRLMKLGAIAGAAFYQLSTLFTKVSLCLFYLRLSPFTAFRVPVYIVMLVSIIHNLLAGFCVIFVCQPMKKYWDFSITTGTCINITAYFLANACINAATDIALLILPLFLVKDYRMPLRRKIGVALLLMTGSFVCVVSLIRVQIVIKGMHSTAMDGTWGMVANFIWLLIEMWMGIVCTCLPAIHKFVRHYFGKNQDSPIVELPLPRGRIVFLLTRC
ncbi:hypothetical protein BKA66DRAFT_544228 [Pyrenochaeta sp. MPI-SDFR-AT-0127]|nr:hypothetical protein BKA66DRAFT_544228 [Pyrenochaeta sp. MPI-SDFR-AT-0127]